MWRIGWLIGWAVAGVACAALRVLIAWWPERATTVISRAAARRAQNTTWTATVRQRIADRWVAEGKAR